MTTPSTLLPSTPRTHVAVVPEQRNLDRQIEVCRKGAQTDRVYMVIERTTKRGTKLPIIEITPQGDIREVPAPTMRTSIRVLINYLLVDDTFYPNAAALTAYAWLSSLVAATDQRMNAKRSRNQERRERHQTKRVEAAVVAS